MGYTGLCLYSLVALMIFRPSTAKKDQAEEGVPLLLIALSAAVLFHGGLLPFTHGKTYDAFIHMFFADHYHRSWFDPWEPRWYTGFVTTSYPPGTHMMMAALMHIVPVRAAFVLVQLVGLLILVVGTYRFALLWVAPRASGYAALALVLSSSISETIHVFGQLPTIFSLGMFLNALPYFFGWIVNGGAKNLIIALALSAATTAAHHVTLIFGGVLFVLPLAVQSLRTYGQSFYSKVAQKGAIRFWRPVARGLVLAVLMIVVVAITVFPYWYWSITDPITQVPIPHGSRESFLKRPDLGAVFFLIPWGVSLFILPYAFFKTATTSLWPLGLSLALCLLLGTGGTTPLPRALLGGAYDILTLDRFTFWGTILILPFTGILLDGLMHGRSRAVIRAVFGTLGLRVLVGGGFVLMAAMASGVACLTTLQPTQPRFVDPRPIVEFMEQDEHDRWRYLTLGFGDQFAYLSAQMTAQSVDGNYHSARRLPDLTRFSVERLENAKYLGVPGLGSLRQFIVNADRYHLKYIFSNDEFYDPLLHFNGWNRLNRLQNGIVIWERPDVTPLPLYQTRRSVPVEHAVMWGVLPPAALMLGFVLLFWELVNRQGRYMPVSVVVPCEEFTNPKIVRIGLISALIVLITLGAGTLWEVRRGLDKDRTPEQVVENYFEHLDYRQFAAAYELLDPEFRPSLDEMLLRWKWQGGLVYSYGKLENVTPQLITQTDDMVDFEVSLSYLTGLSRVRAQREMRLVRRSGGWFVAPVDLPLVQTPVRLQRQPGVDWNAVGRRQPRAEADLHRDRLDRPRIAVDGGRVVKYKGRYSILGQVTNADHDPAAVSLFGTLVAGDSRLGRAGQGQWGGQRLLPGETAGFRAEFDGVLSLRDEEAFGGYDPDQFLPPEFDELPNQGSVDARALVSTRNLYRGVSLNGARFTEKDGQLWVSGLAVNNGTETASITRINALLYGADGRPLWVDAGFVKMNIYPGQSASFSFALPLATEITVIADIQLENIESNGAVQQVDMQLPRARDGTIALNGLGGFSTARLHVSAMTYQPLF